MAPPIPARNGIDFLCHASKPPLHKKSQFVLPIVHVGCACWLVGWFPFGSVRRGGGFGPNGLYIYGTLQECIRLLNGAYKKPTYLNKVLFAYLFIVVWIGTPVCKIAK
jgi:hypothetical protein